MKQSLTERIKNLNPQVKQKLINRLAAEQVEKKMMSNNHPTEKLTDLQKKAILIKLNNQSQQKKKGQKTE